jgi:hypothetical protein
MAPNICEPYKPEEMKQFFTGFMYREEAFLLDEIVTLDGERREVAAVMNTKRDLPYAQLQRPGPGHPAHVSAAELIMSTANLGCLHAWFFYGCRWEEGWGRLWEPYSSGGLSGIDHAWPATRVAIQRNSIAHWQPPHHAALRVRVFSGGQEGLLW